ncbi:hypothetical protein DL991_07595 [Amycolatopsis sp. WAC 01375]|uniref:hypothetical protein n=1 Tax=Amycolatopsis sp. WAC 01375 TaxID=2203194 RepID=UPI000F79870E|nr:hypothetical protein [Amycolatopsis sp. WAC 01375]RSM81393.1 hypothetical protein DL991_07595 [Amycolatopsis sp. WAC 01375]
MNRLLVFLDAIRDHLDEHVLPPAALVSVSSHLDPISVQLDVTKLDAVASALLRWVSTLDTVTGSIVRAPGDSVVLSVAGRTPCGVPVKVYGVAEYDPDVFLDLPARVRQDLPIAVLRGWAATGEVAA